MPAHVEQETTTETHAVTARTADTQRAAVVAKRQDQQASAQQTIVETHTSVPVAKQWSISVMPGVDLTGRSALPYHAVVGASVEHRFIGPLFLGLHGNTAGVVGISIGGSL